MEQKINRESLVTTIEDRFKSQRAGGAFDAKTAGTSTIPNSTQETMFSKTKGFKTEAMQGVSEYKDIDGNKSKELSSMVRGLDTRKYKS
jgi:hypothetical protein